jgi:hypothetical protein
MLVVTHPVVALRETDFDRDTIRSPVTTSGNSCRSARGNRDGPNEQVCQLGEVGGELSIRSL